MSRSAAKKHGPAGPRKRGAWAARKIPPLLVGCLALFAAEGVHGKPGPPVVLIARVVGTDAVSGTALVEIRARSLIKAATLSVRCELPKGATIVPGTGEWRKDRQGGEVLRMRLTLPPAGGKLVIKAEVRGDRIRTGATAGLVLPRPALSAKVPAPQEGQPRIITTNKGERLRLHK